MAEAGDSLSRDIRYAWGYNQILTRLAARENILIGYIVGAATLIGVASSNPGLHKMALMAPLLALGISLILRNHENVIRQMEDYLADLADDVADDWFNRRRMTQERTDGLGSRTLALIEVMGGSSVIALWVSRHMIAEIGLDLTKMWHAGVWLGGLSALAVAIFLICEPRMKRAQQYRRWMEGSRQPL